jgi:hypothetical protein
MLINCCNFFNLLILKITNNEIKHWIDDILILIKISILNNEHYKLLSSCLILYLQISEFYNIQFILPNNILIKHLLTKDSLLKILVINSLSINLKYQKVITTIILINNYYFRK